MAGGYGFVGQLGSYGFASVDLNPPDSAVQLDLTLEWTCDQWDVELYQHYAYVAGGGHVCVFDVEDANAIDAVSSCATNSHGLTIAGEYAYAAGSNGLNVLSLADPELPVVIGSYNATSMSRIAIRDTVAFVAGQGGLRIIDIADPNAPELLSSCPTPAYAHDVALCDQFAYVADDTSGLRVIDVSNPAAPFEVGYYNTPGRAQAVVVHGGVVYVADGRYFGVYECTLQGLHLASPNGDEQWGAFEIHPITWSSAGVEGNVTLMLNRDYPHGVWELIVSDIPNTNSTDWLVNCVISDSCRVKLVSANDSTIFDISDANFSIRRGTITLHPTALDFGDVYPNMTALDTVWIVNSGPDSLLIDSMVCSGTCFGIDPVNMAIPAQDSLSVTVWFGPTGVEDYAGMLTVYTSAGDSSVTLSGDGVTAAGNRHGAFPEELALYAPYPNPFNATTTLRFDLPQTSHVNIEICDVLGRKAMTIIDSPLLAGRHEIVWHCETCASGVYLVVLKANGFRFTQKAVVIK